MPPQHATWRREPFPAPGERRRFGADPAVFQYVPGHGMGLHVLGTWGVVNARLRACLQAKRRGRLWQDCPVRDLERRLDRLGALGARRDGFLAWEYYYAYAQGSPPWISGMAQATAVQALSRAARAFRAPRYRRLAERALGAFETPPPAGVAVDDPSGRRYVMYSFAPGCGSSTASCRPWPGCAPRPRSAAAHAPPGSCGVATGRPSRPSAGSTREPGRSTPPRATRRRSPITG